MTTRETLPDLDTLRALVDAAEQSCTEQSLAPVMAVRIDVMRGLLEALSAARSPDLARAQQALRWLTEPGPGFGEYECNHGVPVLTGECEELDCPSHDVRAVMAARSPEPAHLADPDEIGEGLAQCSRCGVAIHCKGASGKHAERASPSEVRRKALEEAAKHADDYVSCEKPDECDVCLVAAGIASTIRHIDDDGKGPDPSPYAPKQCERSRAEVAKLREALREVLDHPMSVAAIQRARALLSQGETEGKVKP